jgi:hypothetical protein
MYLTKLLLNRMVASRLAMFGRNNLAESLRLWAEEGQSDQVVMLEEARRLHREILEQRELQLGEVFQTWISRINVGMVLQAQGKLEGVRAWYVDLDKLKEAVGESNMTVMMMRQKLKELERLSH